MYMDAVTVKYNHGEQTNIDESPATLPATTRGPSVWRFRPSEWQTVAMWQTVATYH